MRWQHGGGSGLSALIANDLRVCVNQPLPRWILHRMHHVVLSRVMWIRLSPAPGRWTTFLLLGLLLQVPVALGGGGPQQVLVVVNDASANSQELGHYYQEMRGISERQILHLQTSTANQIPLSTYSNEVLNPILDYLSSSGLSDQIEIILLSSDIPSRVGDGTNVNAITSILHYGFRNYPTSPVCTLPASTVGPYYQAERAFSRGDYPGENLYLAAMLTGITHGDALAVVDRAVTADFLSPTGTAYFVRSTDNDRNVQWPQFEHADYLSRLLAIPQTRAFVDGNVLVDRPDVMGGVIGRIRQLDSQVKSNTYRPGAIADHLTSFGGRLFDAGNQMSILKWLQAGCVGSYGTVVEPCNFTNKFPQVRLHYWYGRGFNMVESYTMAVESPYMGIIVGDPLCQPYATPPLAQTSGLASQQVLNADAMVSVSGLAVNPTQRVARIDLYLDDLFWTTAAQVAPEAGDTIEVTVDGETRAYTVQPGDTLAKVAQGVAESLNAPPFDLPIEAEAVSDRILIRQTALGEPGAHLSYSVDVISAGTASVHAVAAGHALLETTYPARRQLALSGTPLAGDLLRTVVKRLDGVLVTNEVTAVANETAADFLFRLWGAINEEPMLQGQEGCRARYWVTNGDDQAEFFLFARTSGWETYNLEVDYEVTAPRLPFQASLTGPDLSGPFSDNADVLSARGMVFLSTGVETLEGNALLPVTSLPDGPHTLRVVASEGSAVGTQGHLTIPFEVTRHALTVVLAEPYTGDPWLAGQSFDVVPSFGGTAGQVTSVTFLVEGKVAAVQTAPPFAHTVNTSEYGAGLLGVQVCAETDVGEWTCSAVAEVRVLRAADEDGDSLPDGWETYYFGDTNVVTGTDDPDGDGQDNLTEFVAGTDPTDPDHFFWSFGFDVPVADDLPRVTFVSTPTRRYAVQSKQPNMLDVNAWLPAEPVYFRGEVGSTTWEDTAFPARPLAPQISGWRVLAEPPLP